MLFRPSLCPRCFTLLSAVVAYHGLGDFGALVEERLIAEASHPRALAAGGQNAHHDLLLLLVPLLVAVLGITVLRIAVLCITSLLVLHPHRPQMKSGGCDQDRHGAAGPHVC